MKQLAFIILYSLSAQVWSQSTAVDSFTLSLDLDQVPQLHIHNINGSVKVWGTDTQKPFIKVRKSFHALDQAQLTSGKIEVHLDSFRTQGHFFLFIKAPNTRFEPKQEEADADDVEGNLTYGYTHCHQKEPLGYTYHFDLELWVPKEVAIHMSTLNEGTLTAENIDSPVRASNLNGPIYLKGISHSPRVHSLNGDIEVEHLSLPKEDESYSTLNGDIRVSYPSSLSAEVLLDTKHGQIYTDFDWIRLKPETEIVSTSKNKTLYKIQSKNRIQIHEGGPKIYMETLNGNLYLLH